MVNVFTKQPCGKCESAKEKLQKLNIDYKEKSYEFYTTYHEGWREDGSIDAFAAKNFFGDTSIPVIQDDQQFFDYPGYMKHAKQTNKSC